MRRGGDGEVAEATVPTDRHFKLLDRVRTPRAIHQNKGKAITFTFVVEPPFSEIARLCGEIWRTLQKARRPAGTGRVALAPEGPVPP